MMEYERHGSIESTRRWLYSFGLGLTLSACVSHDAQSTPEPLSPVLFAEHTLVPALIPDLVPKQAGVSDSSSTPAQQMQRKSAVDSSGAKADESAGDWGASRDTAEIRTLDLATALEIGGASSLQAALAREQLAEAHARLDQAEALWLPNLWAGFGYDKHEGALQETEGNILEVSRNSGSVGGGLFASFDLADAMLEPQSAQHELDAANADVTSSVNDTLLGIALAYSDLLEAQASLALAEDNISLAQELVGLAETFSRSGQGLEADAARARNELASRRRLAVSAELSIELQSVRLATLLRLDPTAPLRASEPRFIPFVLMPEALGLDDLIELAMDSRPEIRSQSSIVKAEEAHERQEHLRPFIPRLQAGLRGGGLGGGTGSNFNDFSGEGEFTARLVWGVRNLGFGESAARRREAAQTRGAKVRLQMLRDSVAEQVTVAYLQARGGRRQVELAVGNVEQSLRSLDLNMRRIRGAEGLPIEALQAIRAAATARKTYLESVGESNRSQFYLLRAVGRAPRP